MTTDQKILKLAGLVGIRPSDRDSGYCWHGGRIFITDEDGLPDRLWNPLKSYDAILPLIQRQNIAIRLAVVSQIRSLGLAVPTAYDATPEQLADALLRVTGKWEE